MSDKESKMQQLDCPRCGQRSHYVTTWKIEKPVDKAKYSGICPKCGYNFKVFFTFNGDK